MNLHEVINEWVGKLSQDEYEFLKEECSIEEIQEEIYRFKESFLSVLLMVLRSHGVKLQPKEKVPMDCQVQLWGIIFNDLKENVIFYPREEEN